MCSMFFYVLSESDSHRCIKRINGQRECDILVKHLMSQILGFLNIIPLAEQRPKGIDLLQEKLNDIFLLILDAVAVIKKYAVKERNCEFPLYKLMKV